MDVNVLQFVKTLLLIVVTESGIVMVGRATQFMKDESPRVFNVDGNRTYSNFGLSENALGAISTSESDETNVIFFNKLHDEKICVSIIDGDFIKITVSRLLE